MDKKVFIKKQIKTDDYENLENCTKEELITRIKALSAHNLQLKNIIAKSSSTPTKKIECKPFDFSKYRFRHIALKILYLGWDYKGYVVQEDTTQTIEHHLFEALLKTRLIKDRHSSNYHRCGRTDKGVSSFGQVISIDVRSNLPLEKNDCLADEINYCKILNKVLPHNIQCVAWSPVSKDFSARFDCKMRLYKYFFPKGQLDIEKMNQAAKKLIGSHDFRNFCKMDVGNGVVEFIRNISKIEITPIDPDKTTEHDMYIISIQANAFLWHQIRCIVGVLFLIGQSKEEPYVIDELLDVKKNPRKPEYGLASEVPLDLHLCDYENMVWYYDKESLNQVIGTLSSLYTFQTIKKDMTKDMITCLRKEYIKLCNEEDSSQNKKCLSEYLIQGIKSKTYIPLMKRKTCNSLEDKIKHFTKRKRIEIVSKNKYNN